MGECKCTMAQSVVGDGCRVCQPETYIDILENELAEDRKEIEKAVNALFYLAVEARYLSDHEIDGGAPDNRWDDMRKALVNAEKIYHELED